MKKPHLLLIVLLLVASVTGVGIWHISQKTDNITFIIQFLLIVDILVAGSMSLLIFKLPQWEWNFKTICISMTFFYVVFATASVRILESKILQKHSGGVAAINANDS